MIECRSLYSHFYLSRITRDGAHNVNFFVNFRLIYFYFFFVVIPTQIQTQYPLDYLALDYPDLGRAKSFLAYLTIPRITRTMFSTVCLSMWQFTHSVLITFICIYFLVIKMSSIYLTKFLYLIWKKRKKNSGLSGMPNSPINPDNRESTVLRHTGKGQFRQFCCFPMVCDVNFFFMLTNYVSAQNITTTDKKSILNGECIYKQ